MSYSAGILNSLVWNSKWTFHLERLHHKAVVRFTALNVASLLVSAFGVSLLVDVLEFNATVSWFGVMSVITVVNFVGTKYWAFSGMVTEQREPRAHPLADL